MDLYLEVSFYDSCPSNLLNQFMIFHLIIRPYIFFVKFAY